MIYGNDELGYELVIMVYFKVPCPAFLHSGCIIV